jgi:hypothetical protein
MSPNNPSSAGPPSLPSAPPQPKKRRWLLYGCGTLLALLLLVVATVALTVWWIQRPIKPVVLSAQEKARVDEKLRLAGGDAHPPPGRGPGAAPPPSQTSAGTNTDRAPDRTYVPGSKMFKLTEREINGLLNANTDLGKTVRLEFARDAINAYVVVPIPQDFPVGGGKMFRARSRFRMSLGNDGAPYAILDDVTVFGVSLPKAWLGGLKGENLLDQATGQRNGRPVLRGIKSLRVEPGALVLEVED